MNNSHRQLMELISQRRSIRQFKPDPVPRQLIEQVLEAARWAPSGGNRQGFRFIVVQSPAMLARMDQAVARAVEALLQHVRPEFREEFARYSGNFMHFAQAPLVIAPIYRSYREGTDFLTMITGGTHSDDRGPLKADADSLAAVSAAIMNLLLAVHTLGLGACWMTGPLFARTSLSKLLEVPRSWEIAALIPLGYAQHRPAAPERRPLARLITYLD